MERAWRVAAIAHSGQKRKATDIPYLVHPAAVALILAASLSRTAALAPMVLLLPARPGGASASVGRPSKAATGP